MYQALSKPFSNINSFNLIYEVATISIPILQMRNTEAKRICDIPS